MKCSKCNCEWHPAHVCPPPVLTGQGDYAKAWPATRTIRVKGWVGIDGDRWEIRGASYEKSDETKAILFDSLEVGIMRPCHLREFYADIEVPEFPPVEMKEVEP